jgi:hypothetical protein
VELFVGEKCSDKFRLEFDIHVILLHAANLQHGTDGFTSPPKEGVLRIFFALKNPTASGVPKASTLPLDYRSRYLRKIKVGLA